MGMDNTQLLELVSETIKRKVDPSFYGAAYGNPFSPDDPSYFEFNRLVQKRRLDDLSAFPTDFLPAQKITCAFCDTRNSAGADRCRSCGAPLGVRPRKESCGTCRVESHEENEAGERIEVETFVPDTPVPTLEEATSGFPIALTLALLLLAAALIALASVFLGGVP